MRYKRVLGSCGSYEDDFGCSVEIWIPDPDIYYGSKHEIRPTRRLKAENDRESVRLIGELIRERIEPNGVIHPSVLKINPDPSGPGGSNERIEADNNREAMTKTQREADAKRGEYSKFEMWVPRSNLGSKSRLISVEPAELGPANASATNLAPAATASKRLKRDPPCQIRPSHQPRAGKTPTFVPCSKSSGRHSPMTLTTYIRYFI